MDSLMARGRAGLDAVVAAVANPSTEPLHVAVYADHIRDPSLTDGLFFCTPARNWTLISVPF